MQQSDLIDKDRINLSDYVSGLYFIKIISKKGSRVERVTTLVILIHDNSSKD